MRNIAIAPRSDWVANQPPPRPPKRRSRTTDWLATLPIPILVLALIVPLVASSAASGPRLTIRPEAAAPGARVVVEGRGFNSRERGAIWWRDGSKAIRSYRASRSGRFRFSIRVPATMQPGDQVLIAIARSRTIRARVTLEVTAPESAKAPVPIEAAPAPTNAPLAPPSTAPTSTPTSAPTSAPTSTPTAAPTPVSSAAPVAPAPTATSPDPTATPRPTATPTATPTPRPTATPTATPTPAPAAPVAPGEGILMSASQIARLPTSGTAWSALKSMADRSVGTPDIQNQDDAADQVVLAKALVYARTGGASYRSAVVAALKSAVGTEAGGRTLALGRNLAAYVIAADLVSLGTADPSFDKNTFRPWLRSLLTKQMSDGRTLIQTHEERPNNWGTHAGASRAAVAAYLNDAGQLARTALVFRGYLGDRSAYAGFKYGELSWQCDASKPVGINPAGCTKNGVSIDGVMPDDMRRGSTFAWPPASTGYPWEGLQGAVLQAELLRVAGYDAWGWSDRALMRATRFLYQRAGWPATGDDAWQPWLLDARYGTSYHGSAGVRSGKNFGYTDWLYGS